MNILDQLIISENEVMTVRQMKRLYEAAHPALAVYALDGGDQVFIGDPVSSFGIWVTKCQDK